MLSDDYELLRFKAALCCVKDHLFKSAAVVFLSFRIHSSVLFVPLMFACMIFVS